MSNKYYHNDIKRQLGIDQSRTASQKLLDKAIKTHKRTDEYLEQDEAIMSQPVKKLKVDQPVLSNRQILEEKLFKNIQNQQNPAKLLKSLAILRKCLNEDAFLNDAEIKFQETWKEYCDRLISQIKQRNFSMAESFTVMQTIGQCLEILWKRFGAKDKRKEKPQLSKEKQQQLQENQGKQQQQNRPKEVQQQGQLPQALQAAIPTQSLVPTPTLSPYELSISFCQLFTDDSFSFNRHLCLIKSHIFNIFSLSPSNTSTELQLLYKLLSLPIKHQWTHTSLINLFKEFNNEGYVNQLENQERRRFLKSYNEMLNRKSSSKGIDTGSFNIMGSKAETQGFKTVHVEMSNVQAADKWVSKQ